MAIRGVELAKSVASAKRLDFQPTRVMKMAGGHAQQKCSQPSQGRNGASSGDRIRLYFARQGDGWSKAKRPTYLAGCNVARTVVHNVRRCHRGRDDAAVARDHSKIKEGGNHNPGKVERNTSANTSLELPPLMATVVHSQGLIGPVEYVEVGRDDQQRQPPQSVLEHWQPQGVEEECSHKPRAGAD